MYIQDDEQLVATPDPAPCTPLLPTRPRHPTTERVEHKASATTQRERRTRLLRDPPHREQGTILAVQNAPEIGFCYLTEVDNDAS